MTQSTRSIFLANEVETNALARQLVKLAKPGLKLYFYGEIGAGKSTFIRAFLKELGLNERIKSPTFSLVEPYQKGELHIYHIDLYRIVSLYELEEIGLLEYFNQDTICCVEWAERGEAMLPTPDLQFYLDIHNSGRFLKINAQSEVGQKILDKISGFSASTN